MHISESEQELICLYRSVSERDQRSVKRILRTARDAYHAHGGCLGGEDSADALAPSGKVIPLRSGTFLGLAASRSENESSAVVIAPGKQINELENSVG